MVDLRSRNKREGLYCGRFRVGLAVKKKSYRQLYKSGCFVTLKEYGEWLVEIKKITEIYKGSTNA